MKIVIFLWYDPLLKRDVCELLQVRSDDLNACLVRLKSRVANEKKQGFVTKHRFFIVDRVFI